MGRERETGEAEEARRRLRVSRTAENKRKVLVGINAFYLHKHTYFYHGDIICLDFGMEKVLQGRRNDKPFKWIP